jgi:hypothetical protein
VSFRVRSLWHEWPPKSEDNNRRAIRNSAKTLSAHPRAVEVAAGVPGVGRENGGR